MKRTSRINSIAAIVQPLQGQQMPADWMRTAREVGAKADADYQDRIQNAWRQPMSTKPVVDNIMRDSRLSK
jgi:hypothetical protein